MTISIVGNDNFPCCLKGLEVSFYYACLPHVFDQTVSQLILLYPQLHLYNTMFGFSEIFMISALWKYILFLMLESPDLF